MRFLNKGVKEATKSILEVGVPAAMDDVYWDDESFAGAGESTTGRRRRRRKIEISVFDRLPRTT